MKQQIIILKNIHAVASLLPLLLMPHAGTSFSTETIHSPCFVRLTSALQATAGDLPTALEWLSEENEYDIEWIDPASPTPSSLLSSVTNEDVNDKTYNPCAKSNISEFIRMPLYPLEACYLPLITPTPTPTTSNSDPTNNHIDNSSDYSYIRNVEPRNLKMAIDLKKRVQDHEVSSSGNPHKINHDDGMARFCAVLKAYDTGRIATMGTVMKVVEFDEQYLWDGKTLARVILKCQPEQVVEIKKICNPNAWSSERRILRSEEYLVADVKPFAVADDVSSILLNDVGKNDNRNGDVVVSDAIESILQDYEKIKHMYETSMYETSSTSSNDQFSMHQYPQFAMDALSNLPKMNSITDETSFWLACNIWQKICFTIKEAHRVNLQSEVNEITISAALAKGGPLNLPVHREDLPFDVRVQLDQLENEVANNFIKEVRMDPCLQFQYLLTMNRLSDKVMFLKQMVSDEVTRLERLTSNSSSSNEKK